MPAAAAAHIAFALALSNDFFARSGGLFLGAAAAATTGARSRSLCRHPRRQPPQARASEILEQRSSTESERIKNCLIFPFTKVNREEGYHILGVKPLRFISKGGVEIQSTANSI